MASSDDQNDFNFCVYYTVCSSYVYVGLVNVLWPTITVPNLFTLLFEESWSTLRVNVSLLSCMSLVVALQWLAASLWLTFNRRSNCESLKRFPVFSKKEKYSAFSQRTNLAEVHKGWQYGREKQLISHWTTETAVGLVELLWMFVCNQGSSTIYLNILCFHMTQADCRGRGLGG